MGIELKTKSGNITLTAAKSSGGGSVDLSNYYTKKEVDALIPSLDGYATETYVQERINDIEIDLSDYYNKDEVDAAIESIKIPEVDLSDYAKKTDIPSLDGYAKAEDIPDVSGFITEIPNEYITETELNAKGYLTQHQSLNGYAKTTDIPDVSAYQTEAQVLALIRANMPASGDEVSY